ncbi:hypothetical protein [Bradyrhizobium sp. CCGB12]|uniref:hypothetical protein n=1 Tax=Bradyrhizobium sp. CCGB12 TaxID=2949632 RepID=UPI0035C0B4F4
MTITRAYAARRPWAAAPHRDAAGTRRVVIVAVQPPQGGEDIGQANGMAHPRDLP